MGRGTALRLQPREASGGAGHTGRGDTGDTGSNATRTPLRETAELGSELGAKRRWKKLDGERSGGRAGAGAGTHRKPGLSPTRLGPGGPLGSVRPGDVGADGHKACGGRVCVWSRKQGRACVTHRLFGLPRLTGAKGQERPGSVPRGAPVGRDGGQRSTQTQPHSDSNSASTGRSHGQ